MKRQKHDDVLEELKAQREELWPSLREKIVQGMVSAERDYSRIYNELSDKIATIKSLRQQELIGTSFLIGFHNSVNALATLFYQLLRPPKLEVKPEEARQNMHDFIMKEFPPPASSENKSGLEDKLQESGEHYLPYDDLVKIDPDVLWQVALQYDWKGLIARPTETLPELVYRGNSLLYLHRRTKGLLDREGLDIEIERKTYRVLLQRKGYYNGKVPSPDLEEALKRVPYYLDLAWFSAYVKDDFIVPALGVTFTLPHYNGIGFIQMLPSYKSRDKFLEVLSHELVHAGTVYLDSRRDYLETKAYHVGRGSLIGEYAVAVQQRPNVIQKVLESTRNVFFPWLPLPDRAIKYWPKIKTAFQIAATTGTFRDVHRKLTALYGQKGNYILGRLTGDEMEEFHYTNDIPARIAGKDSLKWRIMRTNFETLE